MTKAITKQKTKHKLKRKPCLLALGAFAAGFLCSGAKLLGNGFSLGVFAVSVSGVFSPFAILGSFFYYLVSSSLTQGFGRIISSLLIASLFPFLKKHNFFAPMVLSISSCVVMLLAGALECIASGAGSYQIAFTLTDAVICSSLTYMFLSVSEEYTVTRKLRISGADGAFCAVMFMMLVCALSSLPFPLVLGRVAATVVLLFFAKKYHSIGGAVIGVLTACGVALYDPAMSANTLVFASSGLICGAFFVFNDFAGVAALLLSSIVSLTAIGVNSDTFVMFWDIVTGTLISIVLPENVISFGRSYLSTSVSTVDLIGQTASSRLSYAARTLADVRREITVVSSRIEERLREAPPHKKVIENICTMCENYDVCHKRIATTQAAFEILEDIMLSYGQLDRSDIDSYLPHCKKRPILLRAFENAMDELDFEAAGNKGAARMRELLCQQLLSMEQLLDDMSCRVSRIREVDEPLCRRVKELFEINGCRGARVCVYTNENRRRFVEGFINGGFKSDMVRLTVKLSDAVGCDLELPSISTIGKVTRLVFTEKPDLDAEISCCQIPGDGGCCGDTVDTLTLNESERYVLLSDGMGTGELARLDSMFAVDLLSRLISSGVSVKCAGRMVNSALSVRSRDESFSTLDVLHLDLFSHRALFYKSGAAASYIIREGSIIKIRSCSFPAGILADNEPVITDMKVTAGDLLVLTSDGIDEERFMKEYETIPDGLSQCPEKLCGFIAHNFALDEGTAADDITVSVVRLCRSL
ncbi:MAG: SpoIIE family protein phosphatase [Ruminococcus sp.]|nr:SpoIIE family protein phosphatase [Ruminococcus sp.]